MHDYTKHVFSGGILIMEYLTAEASFLLKFNGMIFKALERTLFPFKCSTIIA